MKETRSAVLRFLTEVVATNSASRGSRRDGDGCVNDGVNGETDSASRGSRRGADAMLTPEESPPRVNLRGFTGGVNDGVNGGVNGGVNDGVNDGVNESLACDETLPLEVEANIVAAEEEEVRRARGGSLLERRKRSLGVRGTNQSINQRSSQSHTRAEEKPHPSTTTGGANPASRSDAGLGGYERVATALVCETRSFSTLVLPQRDSCFVEEKPQLDRLSYTRLEDHWFNWLVYSIYGVVRGALGVVGWTLSLADPVAWYVWVWGRG